MTALETPPAHAKRQADSSAPAESAPAPVKKRRHPWLRRFAIFFVGLLILLAAGRAALPHFVRYYVNRTIDQSPLYEGKIGQIEIHLWRGAYTIDDVRLLKRTGNVPVPLFAAKRVDLAVQWDALRHGKVVGRIAFENPELNFVDAGSGDSSQGQTGEGGPWLEILRDLFPFKINSAVVHNGSVHFRAFNRTPPVDVYLSSLEGSIENLKNVRDEATPNVATIKASALAMDQARFEMQMRLNPFSYRPSFRLAARLLGLDVAKTNEFARAYGGFDFERGFFDLVVEVNAREGQVDGYIKPLFRNISVLSLRDVKEDNPLELVWETVVGVAEGTLKNAPRDQFATVIPLRGDLSAPRTGTLSAVGNVLRNAFIRAYLPRLQRSSTTESGISELEFGRGSIVEPSAVGTD
jgi:hypothetical protein